MKEIIVWENLSRPRAVLLWGGGGGVVMWEKSLMCPNPYIFFCSRGVLNFSTGNSDFSRSFLVCGWLPNHCGWFQGLLDHTWAGLEVVRESHFGVHSSDWGPYVYYLMHGWASASSWGTWHMVGAKPLMMTLLSMDGFRIVAVEWGPWWGMPYSVM